MASISASWQLTQMGWPYDDLESQRNVDPEAAIEARRDSAIMIAACLLRDRALDAGDTVPDLLNTNTVQPGGPMFFPKLVKATTKAYEDFEAAKRAGDLPQAIILLAKENQAREAQGLPDVGAIPSYFDVIKAGKSPLALNARNLEDRVNHAGDNGVAAPLIWTDPAAAMAAAQIDLTGGGAVQSKQSTTGVID